MTLAQVLQAELQAESITVVNRRIMGADKGGGFTITTWMYRDKFRAEVQQAAATQPTHDFYYSDREGTTWYVEKMRLAVLDERMKGQPQMPSAPRASELLKDFSAAHVQTSYDWNGRTVTRFTYTAEVGNTDVDQELLVDPQTKLPIKFTSMRDGRSWGDEWTYDYTKIDPSRLNPVLPEGTRLLDHRKQRLEMARIAKAATGQVAMAQIGLDKIALLVRPDLLVTGGFRPFEVRMRASDGSVKAFKGNYNLNVNGPLRVGGKALVPISSSGSTLHREEKWFGPRVSGNLLVGGKTYAFENLPVIEAGNVFTLNMPFTKAYRAR